MSDDVPVSEQSQGMRAQEARRARVAGLAVTLAAAALYGWALSRGGTHYYYEAAVRSMSEDWRTFVYGAFDPAGFMTVDKLPGAFWIQAISARLLGYSSWTLLLPGGLAAVASVPLLFGAVRRSAGLTSGLVAGVVLALTPATFAVARVNLPDTYLVFFLVAAAYALVRAVEDVRWRWLVAAAVLIGAAFQVKMLEAFLVVPAFLAAYLAAAGLPAVTRIVRAATFTVIAMGTSVAWTHVVSLVPSDQRPHVDGSNSDSPWEMVFVYNGATRTMGAEALTIPYGGSPGLGRLLNAQLAGQIGWLLPLVALSVLAAALTLAQWRGYRMARASWWLWGGWFASGALVLSLASGIHPYYVVLLAPATAALIGVGTPIAWTALRQRDRTGWLVPASIVATGVCAVLILSRTPEQWPWLRVVVVIATALGAAVSTLMSPSSVATALTASSACVAMLAAPVAWIFTTPPAAGDLMATTNPVAGPPVPRVVYGDNEPRDVVAMMFGMPPGSIRSVPDRIPVPGPDASVLSYAIEHHHGEPYLFATGDASSAAPYIAAGHSVLPMGGFTANHVAPTIGELEGFVGRGAVRFVLLTPAEAPGPYGARSTWVTRHCAPVMRTRDHSGATLFDCRA